MLPSLLSLVLALTYFQNNAFQPRLKKKSLQTTIFKNIYVDVANGRVGHIKAAHLGTHLLGDGSEAFTAASSKLKLKCFPSLGLLLLFNINSSANEERMEGAKLNDKSRV